MFTWNGNNYTYLYGPKLNEPLLSAIKAKQAILDGEVVVWDNNEKKICPFGSNKTVALASDEENDGKSLCYKVFDILYI